MPIVRTVAVLLFFACGIDAALAEPIKVVVWDEQQPAQKQSYPNFLGNYIADYLKRQPGLQVHSVTIEHPQKGLSDDVLDNCDVLVWWGHVRNRDVSPADAKPVIERLKQGKLSLLALHSAHWATPFVLAMHERAAADALAKLPEKQRKTAKIEFLGKIERRPPARDAELTPAAIFEKQDDGTTLVKITRPNCCFPAYKNHGEPSEMRTLLPDHPIARGIPGKFTLSHTEMYDEPFHVPEPDEVVFDEHWKDGQHFRSGMIWKVGEGRVVYFRPGHETHAVFAEETPLKILENTVRWLGTKTKTLPELQVGNPVPLFDGETLHGWVTSDGKPVTAGWTVVDGTIHRDQRGGNIFYAQEVGDFELSFEWKIEKGGNNGIKYRVRKYGGRELGCEYQILGETKPSFSIGSTGSLYALYEPNEKKKSNPPGEWNTAKIVAHGGRIEHWMNGERIVEADLTSENWRKRLSKSKFSPHKDFARNSIGRIMLTEHGSKVWYRNLVLTPLPTEEIPPLAPEPPPEILVRVVDLNVGEMAKVKLCDHSVAEVKVIDLRETRDDVCFAVRRADVAVEVNGQRVDLVSATYHLPTTVGKVQIDCSVTKGYNSNGEPGFWSLDKDVRLRLWPARSPWVAPGTFTYPVKQRWFASHTQMANVPVFVDGGERPGKRKIYYHSGLDIGGSEGMVEVVAATDALVVSVGDAVLDGHKKDTPVSPRYDVVYLLDQRGWYYRYSHLKEIDKRIAPGRTIKMGTRVGLLGKEGGSGGWSHLHFEIKSRQPSGRWGTQEGYAFLWEAWLRQHKPKLIAVARPHRLVWAGETVVLDATKSWTASGKVERFTWQFNDGETAEGPTAERRYEQPGMYSEVLKITDADGNVDYDFAVAQVLDRQRPDQLPPSIHPNFYPTSGIKPGDEITFKVRTFRTTEGKETWDFGDGSPTVEVQSDGNAVKLAPDGYAETAHRYEEPGHYIVRVERSNQAGMKAVGHLHVHVEGKRK